MSVQILDRADGVEITLTLPSGYKASELKWLSVWCRQFSVDFGHVVFADNMVLPGSTSTTSGGSGTSTGTSSTTSNAEPEPNGADSGADAIQSAVVPSLITLAISWLN